MSRWFRMYDEVLDDPKVQRLSGDDFKAWVNILCLASRKDGALPPLSDIGFALRLDEKKVKAIVSRLVSGGLLDQDGERFTPHGWNARQYKSDVSTNRVKQFRERKKTVSGNGDETFQETAPDTDTESTLAKANGADAPKVDSDKIFWDNAKSFLQAEVKGDAGSLIGRWIKLHGKAETISAIGRAQVERPVKAVPFIEGCFKQQARHAVSEYGPC